MRASWVRATSRAALIALCVTPGIAVVAGPAAAVAPVQVLLATGTADDMVAGGGHIFVSQGYPGGVIVTDYDGANATTIGGLPGASDLSFNADESRLAVSLGAEVALIDTASLTEVARYDLSPLKDTYVIAHGTAVLGSTIWVSFKRWSEGGVAVIDTLADPPTVTEVLSGFYNQPILAASPNAPDRMVVADDHGNWTSYTVSGTTLTERATASSRCHNMFDAATSTDGTFIVCDSSGGPQVIDADDLSVRRTATPSGMWMQGIAVASDGGHFAVGMYSTSQPYDVQAWATTGGSTLLDDFGDSPYQPEKRAKRLAFPPGTTSLVAMSEEHTGTPNENVFRLHIYPHGGLDSSAVSVSGPATAALDAEITLTGQLTFPAGGAVTSPQVLHVARRNYNGTRTALPDVLTDATGNYSTTDVPLGGPNRYYVTWDGDGDEHGPATGQHDVNVTRLATTVSVTTSASPVTYGKSVVVTARLGPHSAGNVLKIYATPYGGAKKLLRSGSVDTLGRLRVSYTPRLRTTYTAVFAGDDRYAPRSASRRQAVRTAVTVTGYRYYGRSSGYLLYRSTATARFVGRVRPNKADSVPDFEQRNVRWYLERYSGGQWRLVDAVTFGLEDNSTSQVWLNGGAPVGSKWRIRMKHPGDRYHVATYSSWVRFRYTR